MASICDACTRLGLRGEVAWLACDIRHRHMLVASARATDAAYISIASKMLTGHQIVAEDDLRVLVELDFDVYAPPPHALLTRCDAATEAVFEGACRAELHVPSCTLAAAVASLLGCDLRVPCIRVDLALVDRLNQIQTFTPRTPDDAAVAPPLLPVGHGPMHGSARGRDGPGDKSIVRGEKRGREDARNVSDAQTRD